MSYRTITDAIATRVRGLTPTTWPTVPFVVRDDSAGPVTSILDDIERGRSRVVEILRQGGPGDDGAAGISDRHAVDIALRVSYVHTARQRWRDQVAVEDAEAIQGDMRDPSWWVAGTYSIETIEAAETEEIVDDATGEPLGVLLSIPMRLRYI